MFFSHPHPLLSTPPGHQANCFARRALLEALEDRNEIRARQERGGQFSFHSAVGLQSFLDPLQASLFKTYPLIGTKALARGANLEETNEVVPGRFGTIEN